METNLTKHPTRWYACQEHIEVLLDQIVDEQEVAPTLLPWEEGMSDSPDPVCDWCQKKPAYILTIEEEHP
ncbi:CxxH/CxxC protein [Kroppenstedtia pulmonis]|uniref:CxxH/CxxC protein n=1 Tax=Kroppenstedtia pulmonis TaxID=1380685 RepID=A0A7D4CI70_9BACL|nr:CxxH/CxxC protein [Kroppenstedtia pulmonis]QKG85794.1 CxxH/CxxC protein [Kroppenstedtia pulmonis]